MRLTSARSNLHTLLRRTEHRDGIDLEIAGSCRSKGEIPKSPDAQRPAFTRALKGHPPEGCGIRPPGEFSQSAVSILLVYKPSAHGTWVDWRAPIIIC